MKSLRVLAGCATALCMATTVHAQAARADSAKPMMTVSGTIPPRVPPRAYLGVTLSMHNGGRPFISKVDEGSPAQRGGFAVGDVVLSIDGHDPMEPGPYWPGRVPGRKYVVRVQRADQQLELELVAASPPQAQ